MCDMQHKGKKHFSTLLHFFTIFSTILSTVRNKDGRTGQSAGPPVFNHKRQRRQQPRQGHFRIPVANRTMAATTASMIIAHIHFFQAGVFLSA